MANMIDPSFLLELGAYAVAAAGIRLLKHRISRTSQQDGHDRPRENNPPEYIKAIGLGPAGGLPAPSTSLTRSHSRSPTSLQAPMLASIDVVDAASSGADPASAVLYSSTCCKGSEGHTGACDAMVDAKDAVNDPDNATDNRGSKGCCAVVKGGASSAPEADAGQQRAKLQTASLEAAQQQWHVSATQEEEERLHSSDAADADAVLPVGMYEQTGRQGSWGALESDVMAVTPASRCADDVATGGAQESWGPAQHTSLQEEGDVDIMGWDDFHSDTVTVGDTPASALPTANTAIDDIISDSEASKHDTQAGSDHEEVSGGGTVPDGDDNSVAASRGILLTAIRKRMRNVEPDLDCNMELFHSKRRAPGPWMLKGKSEASEDIAQQQVPVQGAAPAPGGGGSVPPSSAQPNDLLQEIAGVTLRLLAGALSQNPARGGQLGRSQVCQAVTDQPEQSPSSENSQSKSGTAHHAEGEEEESQVSMGSQLQADSHPPARTQMPVTDVLDQSQHCAGQPDQDVALPFNRQQEADYAGQAHLEQPVQAMDIASSAEEADKEHSQNIVQDSEWAVDMDSSDGEAEEQLETKDAQGPACGRLSASVIWKRLVKKLQGGTSPPVAPQLPQLSSQGASHSGAPTGPGAPPAAAESPSAALHAGAGFADDDFEHGQLSPVAHAMDSIVQPLSSVSVPDLHQSQSEQHEQSLSGDNGSQGLYADQPDTNIQTDWACELPLADSAPPVDVNRPPGSLSPPSSPAWGSPYEPGLKRSAGHVSRASSPDWSSACGAAPDSPVYDSTRNSPSYDSACGPKPFGRAWSPSASADTPNDPNRSPVHRATACSPRYGAPDSPPGFSAPRRYVRRQVWSSYGRGSRSPPLHHASPERSLPWQSPGRTASRSPTPGMASPVSPWHSPPRAARHSPGHYSSSPTSCGSPASQSGLVSHHLSPTSGPSRWCKSPSQDKAEGTVAPVALSPPELLTHDVRAGRAQSLHTEPAEEEEVEEEHGGQRVEDDIPAVGQTYIPFPVSHLHALSDKLHDIRKQAVADELYESSEEDGSVHVKAVVQAQRAEAGLAFDSAEDDERLHGTRAVAANRPEPEVVLGADPEEDCMWEEEEAEGEEDDGVQFISETGPDPAKSAFQMARKRLASLRTSRAGGRHVEAEEEEEEDVELYPGVQELITATLHSPHPAPHGPADFAGELSQSSSILRHFKRLCKHSPAGKVCEPAERSAFWSRHRAGPSGCFAGPEPHQPQAEASAWTHRHGRGGKHDKHHHGKQGRQSDHGHGRRGRWGWLAEASAAAGGYRECEDEMMQDEAADPADTSKN